MSYYVYIRDKKEYNKSSNEINFLEAAEAKVAEGTPYFYPNPFHGTTAYTTGKPSLSSTLYPYIHAIPPVGPFHND